MGRMASSCVANLRLCSTTQGGSTCRNPLEFDVNIYFADFRRLCNVKISYRQAARSVMHLAMQCILNWGIFKYIQCKWRVINYMKSLPYPAHTHTHTPNCSSFPHKNRLRPAEDTLRSSGKSTARWQVANLQVTPFAGVARGWHSRFCRRTRGVKVAKASHFLISFPGAMPLQSPSAEFPPSNQE